MSSKKHTAAFCVTAMALMLAFSTAAFAQGMASGAMSSDPAVGLYANKVIDENEKLRVVDVVIGPGGSGPTTIKLGHVYHYVMGGTVQRTFSDGSKDMQIHKTGETVLVSETRAYSSKNIGKTSIHLIGVALK